MSPWARSSGPADTIVLEGITFNYVNSYHHKPNAKKMAQAIRDNNPGLRVRTRKWQSTFETLWVVYEEAT